MTKEEERVRAVIDELEALFIEDDDFDIYMKERIEKGKIEQQTINTK